MKNIISVLFVAASAIISVSAVDGGASTTTTFSTTTRTVTITHVGATVTITQLPPITKSTSAYSSSSTSYSLETSTSNATTVPIAIPISSELPPIFIITTIPIIPLGSNSTSIAYPTASSGRNLSSSATPSSPVTVSGTAGTMRWSRFLAVAGITAALLF